MCYVFVAGSVGHAAGGEYLLLARKNGEQKMLGATLLIVGIIVWVKLGLGS